MVGMEARVELLEESDLSGGRAQQDLEKIFLQSIGLLLALYWLVSFLISFQEFSASLLRK